MFFAGKVAKSGLFRRRVFRHDPKSRVFCRQVFQPETADTPIFIFWGARRRPFFAIFRFLDSEGVLFRPKFRLNGELDRGLREHLRRGRAAA